MSVQGPSGALWGEMSLPLSPQPSCPHTADSHGLGLPAGFLLLLWELGAKTLEAFGRAGLVPVSSFSAVLKSSETRHVPHELWILLLLLLLSRFSHVRLSVTPLMAAHQAPPSLGFSRQEHWSGLPFPSPVHESGK